MKNYICLVLLIIITGCATTETTDPGPHPVGTIDQYQARNCTYLYSTRLEEDAYTATNAIAYAINELKNQALLTDGNAIRVTDVHNSTEWNYRNEYSYSSYGYEQDVAVVSVEVYKCPVRFNSDIKKEQKTES